MDKKELRSNALETRNSIPEVSRTQKSSTIIKKLEEIDVYKNAEHVLFYYTHGSEVDTIPAINKWIKEKNIYLPKLKDKNEFIALPFRNFDALKKGIFKIPEPIGVKEDGDYEKKLDLIIVPGVAFDQEGTRLGMGKGFYDRYLRHLPHTPRIALAFEEQVLESIPKDPYDEPVNIIITDENIYNSDF